METAFLLLIQLPQWFWNLLLIKLPSGFGIRCSLVLILICLNNTLTTSVPMWTNFDLVVLCLLSLIKKNSHMSCQFHSVWLPGFTSLTGRNTFLLEVERCKVQNIISQAVSKEKIDASSASFSHFMGRALREHVLQIESKPERPMSFARLLHFPFWSSVAGFSSSFFLFSLLSTNVKRCECDVVSYLSTS